MPLLADRPRCPVGVRAQRRAAPWRATALGLVFVLAAVPGLAAADADITRPGAGERPTEVALSLYLADLYEISGGDQTFVADLVLQAEWLDPRLRGRWPGLHSLGLDEIWHPRFQLLNQRSISTMLPERVEVHLSGRVLYRQRWSGRFGARLRLEEFPFDRQIFRVQLVTLGYSPGEVDLTLDAGEFRSGRAAEFSLTDWDIGPATATLADLALSPGFPSRAGAELRWEAKRREGFYAVQVILPLVLIVLMGLTGLWVDPSVVTTRMNVATTMLTLIAYRFTLGRSVPNLNYMTRFDYFMLAATTLVFLIVVHTAATARLVALGRSEIVLRRDRWARPAFPVTCVIVFFLSLWH